ncbi:MULTISPECIES: hypothetical protein [Fischerella]|nr:MULTISPECIES: hypothetical protein [Fischerella]
MQTHDLSRLFLVQHQATKLKLIQDSLLAILNLQVVHTPSSKTF